MALRAKAPAKINLGLHVLRRRSDGYHDLETVFLRLPWADDLAVEPADALTLTCSDPALPTDEGNLCVRAAQALAAHAGIEAGAALHLEKDLPYGAGLGGGSSDAAATLHLLRDLWHLERSDGDLQAIGATIGSDVPFFLQPEAAAFAEGRGERLTPLRMPETDAPYAFPFGLVVAVPPVPIATAEAYRHVRPRTEGRPDLRALVASNDLAAWRRHLVNDFEAWALEAHPPVAETHQALQEAGADYVALSGSGAAVYGVFERPAQATAAAQALRLSFHRTRVWHGVV